MRDVAAPLYRFFLTDAQTAARAGETARALECLGLALDFAPESQRERVLLAASELAPPAVSGSTAAGLPRAGGPPAALVVEIAPDRAAARAAGRIAWEDRPALPAPLAAYPTPPDFPARPGAPEAPRAPRPLRRLTFLAGVLAVMMAAAVGLEWAPSGAAEALGADPAERAARALEAGDEAGALRLLEPLGAEAPAPVWLLRGSAHEALADTPAAVAALATAAARDADGGRWALEAGDRLGRLGAVRQAADAYLYAVTPARTDGELDRIARMQERAGHADRARRVRQR